MSKATDAAAHGPPAAEQTGLAGWARKNAASLYRWEVGMHVFAAAATLVLLVAGTEAAWNVTVNKCDQIQPGSSRGWILAVATILGAIVGRIVAHVRYEVRRELNKGQHAKPPAKPIVHIGAFAFLVIATALLLYETWAIANFSHPPPITSYVRCAAYYHQIVAPLTAAGIGFLVSNWFWYPTR